MICIISVTEKGDVLAEKIKMILGGEIYAKSKLSNFNLYEITKVAFKKYEAIIFISSTGIAVRAIASSLISKDKDPAVVVVDVCNMFSISLVSGHLGGANKLSMKVSEILNNTPVITTATDNMNIIAPDVLAKENNLLIDSLKEAKIIASKLVNGESVYFKDDKEFIECPKGYISSNDLRESTVWITNKLEERSNILKLIRKDIVLGVGCRKNTDYKKLYQFVKEKLKAEKIDLRAVKIIASIDIKKDEEAILKLANKLESKLKFFTAEEINTAKGHYEESDFVRQIVGVGAVSEPVVELVGGEIIMKKVKLDGMTLTIGEVMRGEL